MYRFISYILLLVSFLFPNTPYCQTVLCSHEEINHDNLVQLQSRYSITANLEAYNFIKKIMQISGLPVNFVVQKVSGARNAFAYMDTFGTRYILYDDIFLNSLNSDSSNTEFITVLAHEIGHHLAGHSLSIDNFIQKDSCLLWCNSNSIHYDRIKKQSNCEQYLNDRRRSEIEADTYAGYIMSKLDADISVVQNTFDQISKEQSDKYSTHPSLNKRLAAIKKGYSISQKGIKGHLSVMSEIKESRIPTDKIDFAQIKKKKLITKISTSATHEAVKILNQKSPVQIGSLINLDEMKPKEDTSVVMQFSTHLYIHGLDIAPIPNLFHIKVKNEMVYIIMLQESQEKVIYTSVFSEDKISFSEITNLFATIYESLVKQRLKNLD